jgi:hypothetical protein
MPFPLNTDSYPTPVWNIKIKFGRDEFDAVLDPSKNVEKNIQNFIESLGDVVFCCIKPDRDMLCNFLSGFNIDVDCIDISKFEPKFELIVFKNASQLHITNENINDKQNSLFNLRFIPKHINSNYKNCIVFYYEHSYFDSFEQKVSGSCEWIMICVYAENCCTYLHIYIY